MLPFRIKNAGAELSSVGVDWNPSRVNRFDQKDADD